MEAEGSLPHSQELSTCPYSGPNQPSPHKTIRVKNGVFWDVTPCGSVRTDVEELSASFIRVTRIGELETTLAVTSNRRTLRRNTSRLNIPEDTVLHSYRSENLKSYNSSEVRNHVISGSVVVKALCYKPEGRGFETR
jgi:hypothetical protein